MGTDTKMSETGKINIREKAMEWVNDSVYFWVREGLDLKQIFNRSWFYYGIVVKQVNNSARKGRNNGE